MLINKRVISIIVSLIMTVALFMTQVLASELDTGSDNEGSGDTAVLASSEGEGAPEDGSVDVPAVSENAPASDKSGDEDKKETEDKEETVEKEPEETEEISGEDEVNVDEPSEEAEEAGADLETVEKTETAATETEASEEEWLEDHGVKQNEDGSYEYTDENGDTWEFAPEDPEMFKRIGDEGDYDHQTEITLKGKRQGRAALGEEQDPYTLILNPDFKYRYPSFFTPDEDGALPDVRCGMDISRYQGEISVENWKKLKEDYGIEFVFIRAGYRGYGGGGSLNVDSCCGANIENAYEAGVAVGIYYFSQAISEAEAVSEAEDCLAVIDGYKDKITLPVVTDYEYSGSPGRLRGAGLSDSEHTAIVNAFCDRVEEEGYTAGIYANKSMLQQDMVLEDIPEEHVIWMANFVTDDGAGTYSTSYGGALGAWQFSSRFTGFGEARNGLNLMKSAYLDLDLWYGDLPGEDRESIHIRSDEAVKVVDVGGDEEDVYIMPEEAAEKSAEPAPGEMSIRNTVMTAEDVVYSPRPRSCHSVIKICDSDGSRLAAGFDYDRELEYTYEEDTVVKRRTDMWARHYEEVAVKAGDSVDMKRDVIPAGTVIRVTATGKGRYEDPEGNTVSTTFRVIPEKEKQEEPVEIEAVTEEGPSGKQKRLLTRLVVND